MSAADNKELLTQAFDELGKGANRAFVDCLADGCAWTIMGTTSWSKTFEGKDAILGELFATLRTRLEAATVVKPINVIADGNYVVVEANGIDNMAKSGMPYNNRYCFVFQLDAGKVIAVREYTDTALVERALGTFSAG